MSWNYRVMEFKDVDGEVYYAVHEVYYDEDGKPIGYTANAAVVVWGHDETPVGILERMAQAFARPVLRENDFPQGGTATSP